MDFNDVDNSEPALARAVTKQPVSVAIQVDETWMHYKGGIMTGLPKFTGINHGVLVVGFSSENGQGRFNLAEEFPPLNTGYFLDFLTIKMYILYPFD